MKPDANEIVCLHTAYFLYAVSQFYASFPQVEDDEVISILASRASVS